MLTHVSERLSTKFPDIPKHRVNAVVENTYHGFDGARIRDFLEILVERDATDLLSHGSA